MTRFICALLPLLILLSSGFSENWMVTLPRSGTHLFCNLIMYSFGTPCTHIYNGRLLKNETEAKINWDLDEVCHAHASGKVLKKRKPGDKLIYIVRDYKENCINQDHKHLPCVDSDEEFIEWFKARRYPGAYRTNLLFFDEWEEGCKLLVYYEDLLMNPEKVARDVADFLGYDYDEDTFLERMEAFSKVQESLRTFYYTRYRDRNQGGSKGLNPKHYQLNFSKKSRDEVDRIMRRQFKLFDKYLSRYYLQNDD